MVQLKTIIASTDPVAVDAYTVPLVPWYGQQFTGKNVKFILRAAEMGLGKIDASTLKIKALEV